jgi:polyisoprenoid-binding protein YceI
MVVAVAAQAGDFKLDTTHSQVMFKIKHMTISTVTGQFKEFDGTLSVDPAKPETLTVKGTVKAASINTNVEKRDEHLRSADFFDVAQFPEITFASRKSTAQPGGNLSVEGDLTMHGVTRPVTLTGSLSGVAKDPWGNERIAATLEGKINRTDFGLKWNKALEAGGFLVGEDVSISVELEAIAVK